MAKKKTEEPLVKDETVEAQSEESQNSQESEVVEAKPKLVATKVFEPMQGTFRTVWSKE